MCVCVCCERERKTAESSSYWTNGRGAEASLLVAAQARGLSRPQLSFPLSQFVALPVISGIVYTRSV